MSTDGRKIYRHWKLGPFEYRSDLIAHDYMRRWMVKTPWGMLRLHRIMRSDSRDHFHDHPMDFVSLILSGGYVEYRPNQPPKHFPPGSVVVRRAEDLHYLELMGKPAWTFLVTSLPRREWGFATEEGWIGNDHYDAWLKEKQMQALRELRRVLNTMPGMVVKKGET